MIMIYVDSVKIICKIPLHNLDISNNKDLINLPSNNNNKDLINLLLHRIKVLINHLPNNLTNLPNNHKIKDLTNPLNPITKILPYHLTNNKTHNLNRPIIKVS